MMRLMNVRKGQFVYYNNKLHKVYAVKPFFKQSIHLIRLSDLHQEMVTARDITLYRPKHLDSFIYNGQRYTLDKNVRAKVGDYILVINPRPDSLDRHYLHAIEIVTTVENGGVISNKMNGIKHNEYWTMVPEFSEGARKIDWQDPSLRDDEEKQKDVNAAQPPLPKIGDIYQKNDSEPLLQVMVVGIEGQTVYLGDGTTIEVPELIHSENWSRVLDSLS